MARDHSAGAGGDPAILEAKRALREEIWTALSEAGAARFPGVRGRIPNFSGAEAAAERLRGAPAWRAATRMKANPDSPQRPVRQRALEDGMVVYMAAPRLAAAHPFLLLDPARLAASPWEASSIKGASAHAEPVAIEQLAPVDVVIMGCVGVDRTGARLGKGGGFADLEFALASAAGLIGEQTVTATTVHPQQIVPRGRIPMTDRDVPLDLIVTPDEVIRCEPAFARPSGIRWQDLTEEKILAIPLLAAMRDEAGGPDG